MKVGDGSFDQVAFGRAIEAGDVGYQVSRYANHAQVQVREFDPNNTSPGPTLQLFGAPAIQAWIHATAVDHAKPPIVMLHVIEDYLAFIERWRHRNGLNMLSCSTAELCDGLITFQHTAVLFGNPGAPDGKRDFMNGLDGFD